MAAPSPPQAHPKCGTPTGHRRHHKAGEASCDACLKAHRDAQRARALRRAGVDPSSVTHGTFGGGMVCSCFECRPWAPVPHGTQVGYRKHCCRCDACREAHAALVSRQRQKDPSRLAQRFSRWSAAAQEANSQSRNRAHRNGQQWRVPELELVARGDLTTEELAESLGRTVFAVRRVRGILKREAAALDRGFTTGSR